MKRRTYWALLLVLLAALVCAAAEVPGPMVGTYVHDFAGVIPADREAEIQAKAQRLKDVYRTEIAVVTIESLQGEESFDYSMRMARSWGIGSKESDVRGLLILVAVKDRKTAFRTSRHIEGELPDGITGEISRQMNTHFKDGDFGAGLSLGLDRIHERLQVAYEPRSTVSKAPEPESGLGWLWLPVLTIPALGVGYAVARRRSRKGKRSEPAGQSAAKGSFRAWAETKDPSPKPKKQKSQGITRAKSRPAKKGKQSSKPNAETTTYASHEPTAYNSSSSYDSSSSNYSSSSSYDSGSSYSYDSGSSYSSDSGSSYSGGSDFGGGGSDSNW